jgi:1-acyl-sn-glycerol-3-phosphate acyltransferase
MAQMLTCQEETAAARFDEPAPIDLSGFHERSLHKGVNPVFYRVVRAVFVPFFLVYFRMQRVGREHLPRSGPLLLASNHRSFLDPFVIGTLVKRPVYYMAKRELFEKRWQAWALNALGAFPVDRGAGDQDAMATAWSSSPRARARAPARSASQGAGSGAWRWRQARRWYRWP